MPERAPRKWAGWTVPTNARTSERAHQPQRRADRPSEWDDGQLLTLLTLDI